eukprot:m.202966 g.202966  ORF g.202966 m.202966 type:complete len:60 (-) comp14983_c0_seq1:5313-5492(-)
MQSHNRTYNFDQYDQNIFISNTSHTGKKAREARAITRRAVSFKKSTSVATQTGDCDVPE